MYYKKSIIKIGRIEYEILKYEGLPVHWWGCYCARQALGVPPGGRGGGRLHTKFARMVLFGLKVSEMSEAVFTQYGYFLRLGHSIWVFP